MKSYKPPGAGHPRRNNNAYHFKLWCLFCGENQQSKWGGTSEVIREGFLEEVIWKLRSGGWEWAGLVKREEAGRRVGEDSRQRGDVPCLSPSTNPTCQSQGYTAHWSSCTTLQPSLCQWEILPRGRKATSVLFGGELMSPAMCCRRRWQLFDLSLADIPSSWGRGRTKIDLKCIRRSPPAYAFYSGSRRCPDKGETVIAKWIVEKLKGFGQTRVQTVDAGQAASLITYLSHWPDSLQDSFSEIQHGKSISATLQSKTRQSLPHHC